MVDVAQLQATLDADNSEKARGAISGPALPASTVESAPAEQTLLGRISAGTVTVFKIDGVTIGGMTTGEWFKLRAGSTFNITYSVAPTLQWFHA